MGRAEHTSSENNVLSGNIILVPKLSENVFSLGDKVPKQENWRKWKWKEEKRKKNKPRERESSELVIEEQQGKGRVKISNYQNLS